jgi:23S rRNA (guanosine2251-2'-O)-methyltransferase
MTRPKDEEHIHGVHPVTEALRAGRRRIIRVYIHARRGRPSARLTELADAAVAAEVPVETVSADTLAAMAGTDAHQGAVARVSLLPFVDPEDLRTSPAPFLLILDSLEDPQNVGALIRTAVCAGVDGVIIPKDRAAPPSPAVSRASAGALEHVRLARVTNLARTLEALKSSGVWLAGLDRTEGGDIYAADLTGALGLVIGGERRGLRPLIRKHCDFLISIPQMRTVDSLNASAAGAIALYESVRQRLNIP